MLKKEDHYNLIDTHCHILPNVDDGPASLGEALEMARVAVRNEVCTIVATPHHGDGNFDNNAEFVDKEVSRFNTELLKRNIPLSVLSGQEVRVNSYLLNDLFANKIRTLNRSQYILLELPSKGVPIFFDELLHELSILQLRPVIAHPERNNEFLRSPSRLRQYVEQGILCQITAQSVMGLFGKKIQKFTFDLCKKNWVHLVASDAHNTYSRPGMLKQSYMYLEQKVGGDQVQYFKDNAFKLIRNEAIHSAQSFKKSLFYRWSTSST